MRLALFGEKTYIYFCILLYLFDPSLCIVFYQFHLSFYHSQQIHYVWGHSDNQTKRHWRRNSFLYVIQTKKEPEACNFIKKETLAQLFFCELGEISKNTFFTEHLWTTTFGHCIAWKLRIKTIHENWGWKLRMIRTRSAWHWFKNY